jgi:hypothetical protein
MPQLTKALLAEEAEEYGIQQVLCTQPSLSLKAIEELCNSGDGAIESYNESCQERGDDCDQLLLCEEFEDLDWDEAIDKMKEFSNSIIHCFARYCIDHEDSNNA